MWSACTASGVERNNARLAAGLAADEAARDAHVVHVQVDQLTDANAGCIQNLEHRLVAAALHIACARLLEQKLDLFSGQDLRQSFFGLSTLMLCTGFFSISSSDKANRYRLLSEARHRDTVAGDFPIDWQPLHVRAHDALIGVEHVNVNAGQI